MKRLLSRLVSSKQFHVLVVALLLLGTGLFYTGQSFGAELPSRSIQLSDSTPSATASFRLGFTIPATEMLGSIEVQFCANDPIVGSPCIAPTGLNISTAALTNQSGETGFSVSASTTVNDLILTRTAANAAAGAVSYSIDNLINPSSPGTYFVRLQTFASTDASGPANDHGGLAFSINVSVSVSVTVPPYLLFCTGVSIPSFDCATATGAYINFGNFTTTTASSAQSQMLLATNAANGYTIDYGGTTLTSGINTIAPLSTSDVSRPGVSQFGINAVSNQDPSIGQNPQGLGSGGVTAAYNQPNLYKFIPNDIIASSTTTSDYKEYTVSYVTNVSKNQTPGVYASTLTYVALSNF